jgi:hypothetical protein
MLTGKAVARAVRGHFIVDSCLNVLLLHNVLEQVADCSGDSDCLTEVDLQDLRSLYDSIINCSVTPEQVSTCSSNHKLERLLTKYKDELAGGKFRTAQL